MADPYRHRAKAAALLRRSGYADGGAAPRYVAVDSGPEGMVEPGNIDLNRTPSIVNPEDGRVSSVLSSSYSNEDGSEAVMVPGVKHGKGFLEDPEKEYRETGEHLGKFRSTPDKKASDLADQYADTLHRQQENMTRDRESPRMLGRRARRRLGGR